MKHNILPKILILSIFSALLNVTNLVELDLKVEYNTKFVNSMADFSGCKLDTGGNLNTAPYTINIIDGHNQSQTFTGSERDACHLVYLLDSNKVTQFPFNTLMEMLAIKVVGIFILNVIIPLVLVYSIIVAIFLFISRLFRAYKYFFKVKTLK